MGRESLTADEVSSALSVGSIAEASIDLRSLRHFLRDVPDLRRLLSAPASGEQELLLREAMRRAVAALATVLDGAAGVEAASARAAVLRGTSRIASELAECGAQRNSADH